MKSSAPRGDVRAGFGRLAVALHAFGEAPGPDRQRLGSEGSLRHLAQHFGHALFFGGANVGERPAGFEDLPNHLGGAAFSGRLSLAIEQDFAGAGCAL